MFLHLLTTEEQKNFLELANVLINCDNYLSNEELQLMNTYRYEMRISEDEYLIQNTQLEEILNALASTSIKNKKVILIELIALSLSDNDGNSLEKELIDKVANKFEIDEIVIKQSIEWVQEMTKLSKKVEDILN
ncbi:hypothetical protein [Haloimpatiens massiliensis]|uniref:hypothetical protein n=1 Tax=Haloimpatiens massiliensis TaxID=1658110 RepID=UPI000C829572|nr:hypothetical protein [Haloimpatiens massiliensis]